MMKWKLFEQKSISQIEKVKKTVFQMKTFNNNTLQKFRGRKTEIRYFVYKNFNDVVILNEIVKSKNSLLAEHLDFPNYNSNTKLSYNQWEWQKQQQNIYWYTERACYEAHHPQKHCQKTFVQEWSSFQWYGFFNSSRKFFYFLYWRKWLIQTLIQSYFN